MADFILFAGRFKLADALAAMTELAGPEPPPPPPFGAPPAVTAAWGAAWVYGNRLEVARSSHHPLSDPDFRKLGEIRTDMAMFYVAPHDPPQAREMMPFLRREGERQWAFCHSGTLRHPARIQTAGRIVDGRNPSEKLFLHVLSGLNIDDPLPSVERSLELLADENDLNFLLLSADMLVASCRYDAEAADARPTLCYGTGESMRVLSTRPVTSVDVSWDAMANGSVSVVSRKRWEL